MSEQAKQTASKQKPAASREREREEVTLKKPHEHGGERHDVGAKIRVTASQKKFLTERGKI